MNSNSPITQFLNALESGITPQITDEMAASYPWFTLPAALELKAGCNDPERKRDLMARVALNAPDPGTLFRLIDPEGTRFARFYPPEKEPNHTPSTEDALDTFMQNYGSNDPKEQALLEKLIFNPVPDYAGMLIKENSENPAQSGTAPASEQDSRLDAFLASHPDSTGTAAANPSGNTNHVIRKHNAANIPAPPADSPLSESLAKFHIKRHHYDKAYEIIHGLSLNFPEKSIYFADQLRFLRKLIISQKIANEKKQ